MVRALVAVVLVITAADRDIEVVVDGFLAVAADRRLLLMRVTHQLRIPPRKTAHQDFLQSQLVRIDHKCQLHPLPVRHKIQRVHLLFLLR
jgi:hypothetical protein